MARVARRPPGPRSLLDVRNWLAYERDRIGFLRQCREDYGDWVAIDDRTFLVSDIDAIGQMLQLTNTAFSLEGSTGMAREPSADAENVVAAHVAARRRILRGMAKVPARAHVAHLPVLMEREFARVQGQRVDLALLLRRIFGTDAMHYLVSSTDPDLVDAAFTSNVAMNQITTRSVDPPGWLPSARRRRARNARARVAARLRELREQRRSSGRDERQRDVLDAVLHDGDPAGQDQVETGLMGALRAAFGSTGVAATWAIKEVARRPEVRRRIEAEAPDEERLRYVSAVVDETLRLHPPVWLLVRDVRRPAELGGWSFRPGDRLLVCLPLVHRDKRWWTDPESFLPERWLGEEPPAPPYAYLPQGGGPRACLGGRLATTQLSVGLAYLWRHVEFELDDPDDMAGIATALLAPARSHARIRLLRL